MKTSEFISDCVRGNQTKPKSVSSVYFDGNTIFSYGEHYPLLFKIKGAWFMNDYGYSNTTARHISWAKPYAQFTVSLPYGTSGTPEDNTVINALTHEITEKTTEHNDLKRKNTKRAGALEARIVELTQGRDYIINN